MTLVVSTQYERVGLSLISGVLSGPLLPICCGQTKERTAVHGTELKEVDAHIIIYDLDVDVLMLIWRLTKRTHLEAPKPQTLGLSAQRVSCTYTYILPRRKSGWGFKISAAAT